MRRGFFCACLPGNVQVDYPLLRQISSICNQLPTMDGAHFSEEFMRVRGSLSSCRVDAIHSSKKPNEPQQVIVQIAHEERTFELVGSNGSKLVWYCSTCVTSELCIKLATGRPEILGVLHTVVSLALTLQGQFL